MCGFAPNPKSIRSHFKCYEFTPRPAGTSAAPGDKRTQTSQKRQPTPGRFDRLPDTRHPWIFRRDARLSHPIAVLRLVAIGLAIPPRRALLSGTRNASRFPQNPWATGMYPFSPADGRSQSVSDQWLRSGPIAQSCSTGLCSFGNGSHGKGVLIRLWRTGATYQEHHSGSFISRGTEDSGYGLLRASKGSPYSRLRYVSPSDP